MLGAGEHIQDRHQKISNHPLLTSEEHMFSDETLLIWLFSLISEPLDAEKVTKILLARFGNLATLLSVSKEELSNTGVLTEEMIVGLKLAQLFGLRLLRSDIEHRPVLQSWKAVLDYCRACMASTGKEQFRVLYLDTKNQLIADELQQVGTVNYVSVYVREVIKRTLDLGASALILVHTHLTGDPNPSKADLEMTRRIVRAANTMSITIHDHIILAGKRHYSFAAHDLL